MGVQRRITRVTTALVLALSLAVLGGSAAVAANEESDEDFIWSDSDFSGDGTSDVLARDTSGRLWLYAGDGYGGWLLPPVQVGKGWNGMTAIVAPGDFDGDWNNDVLARDTAGRLWLYSGNGYGGWLLPPVQVGKGWNGMTAIVAPGDFDGDLLPDLLARDTSGRLWLYSGNGYGGWLLPPVQVGNGWNGMTAIVGPGYFDGDWNNDVLARDTAGRLWLYSGDGYGGWLLPPVQVGNGWNGMTAIVGPGDFDGDIYGYDVLARDTAGRLWLYPGDGYGGWWLPPVQVGNGWNGMTAIVS